MSGLTKILSLGLLGLVAALLVQLAFIYRDSLQFAKPPEAPEPFTCPVLDEAAALDRFRGLLTFPSISNMSREEHVNDPQVFQDMMSYLERSYPLVWSRLEVEKVGINGLSLLLTWRGSRPELPPVLFVSHYDVVPVTPGSETAWRHPPFSGEIAEGYVWGRGATDIKFSVAALLEAVSGLLRLQGEGEGEGGGGFSPERTMLLAFGHDEEIGGWHGARATSELLRARYPELDVVVDEGGVVLSDGLRPFISGRPVAMVGLAEKGYVTMQVTLHSPGGHSSMPPVDGSDVQSQLWRLSTALKLLPTPTVLQPPVTDMLLHVVPYAPTWMRPLLVGASRGPLKPLVAQLLRRVTGRETSSMVTNTLALTRLQGGVADNVLPQEAHLTFNSRMLPGFGPEDVAAHVQRAARLAGLAGAEVRIKQEGGAWAASRVTPAEGRHFKMLSRAIRETWQTEGQAPLAVVPYLVSGATDSKHYGSLARGGVLRFVPYALNKTAGDLGLIHGTNERIRADSLSRAVCTYQRLMQLLAGPEGH